jgi:hypothetical protein
MYATTENSSSYTNVGRLTEIHGKLKIMPNFYNFYALHLSISSFHYCYFTTLQNSFRYQVKLININCQILTEIHGLTRFSYIILSNYNACATGSLMSKS